MVPCTDFSESPGNATCRLGFLSPNCGIAAPIIHFECDGASMMGG